MNNYNTFTPNTNKLNLDDGYNKQHIETPYFSQFNQKMKHTGQEMWLKLQQDKTQWLQKMTNSISPC